MALWVDTGNDVINYSVISVVTLKHYIHIVVCMWSVIVRHLMNTIHIILKNANYHE